MKYLAVDSTESYSTIKMLSIAKLMKYCFTKDLIYLVNGWVLISFGTEFQILTP